MSQTSYPLVSAVAFPGMLAEVGSRKSVISRINDDSVNIPFGRAVQNIPGEDNNCELVDATGDKILGVSIHRHCEAGAYEPTDPVSILREGTIWVEVDGTVVEHGDVFVKHSDGSFLAADDAGNSSKLTNARWYHSRTGAGLVVLELGSNISPMT